MEELIFSNDERNSFRDTFNYIEEMRWETMEPDKLKLMISEIQKEQRQLFEELKTIREEIDDGLHVNNVSDFEKSHVNARRIKKKYERLEKLRDKLSNCRQRQIVRLGMYGTLGKGGTLFLERTVLVLIIVVLSLISYEMFTRGIDRNVLWVLFFIDLSACAVFQFEFFLRLYHADDKRWFWRHNWIDFVSSIPIPPADIINWQRWGRLLRLVRILRLSRAFRILTFLWRGMDTLVEVTNVKMMKKSLIWILTIIIFGAVLVQYFERGIVGGDQVASFSESIWWTFNTVATGEFADLYKPKSLLARLVTTSLIIAGFVVMGVFIAALSSLYRGEESEGLRLSQEDLKETLASLKNSHQELKDKLERIMQS